MAKRLASRYSEISSRIPKDYFWVIGWGEREHRAPEGDPNDLTFSKL